MRTPVLIDTDIGTDIDDLLALLTVFGSPELEVAAITATYGDTLLRSRIAKQVCDWAGISVAIGAGPIKPLSGREVWVAGHEELLLQPDHAAARYMPRRSGDVIAETIARHASELAIVGIGPLTNLVGTLDDQIRQIVIMGGDFSNTTAIEHNFQSDAVAAQDVMTTGTSIRVIGVDQTRRIRISRDQIMDLAAGDGPLRAFLRREAERWLAFNDDSYLLLHDPMTVTMLTNPETYEFERGTVAVATEIGAEGSSRFFNNPEGSVEIVRSIDEDLLRSLLMDRIAAGLSA